MGGGSWENSFRALHKRRKTQMHNHQDNSLHNDKQKKENAMQVAVD